VASGAPAGGTRGGSGSGSYKVARAEVRPARRAARSSFPSPPPAPLRVDFPDRLRQVTAETGTCLCVGLDPDPARLPSPLAGRSAGKVSGAVLQFCNAITEATAPHAAAFKPNLAFFEALGPDGAVVLEMVAIAVREAGRLLVLDGKRGDVGHTAERYAAALYDRLGADAVTVAPYMGRDSLTPFLQHEGRCAFALVATSNPGADDLQGLDVGGEPLYRHVARLAASVGAEAPGTAGFVVGATRPAVLAGLREEFPDVPFLVPGVGAQGGEIDDVLRANAGGPLLVNVSRSILYAAAGDDFAEAAGAAARRYSEQLRVVRRA
jgi:orotidine-5'-phosphate decarboxylase